jgi:2-iminobutanoate/2-iminopropanoate deaminase
MPIVTHNPPGVFPPYRAYSHAVEVRGGTRLLVISGLNGFEADGVTMPESFDAQAELVWTHLETILRTAGMDVHDLVSIRTYLADPADDEANVLMRVKHLRGHAPASTVVCCRLLDPRWKLEVEAMASK